MPTNLTQSDLNEIADKINDAIDDYSIKTLQEGPRNHLGMSGIGGECIREIWYNFRWANFQNLNGRMLRLLKRGHREEERYVSILEGIGCKVERFDENGKQFRVSSVMGHYGGSCDGRAITPWMPNKVLLEFKTHNTGSFSKYATDKDKILDNAGRTKALYKTKPQHVDQMHSYGYFMNLDYAIYFPENKNDDDIVLTVLKLDHSRGRELELRAQNIILAEQPPERVSDNPSYWKCRYCDHLQTCHHSKPPVKNCRSCRFSKPIEGGLWACTRFNSTIPSDWIKVGCEGWTPI